MDLGWMKAAPDYLQLADRCLRFAAEAEDEALEALLTEMARTLTQMSVRDQQPAVQDDNRATKLH